MAHEEQERNLHLAPKFENGEEVKTIILREGQAPEPDQIEPLLREGNISAPGDYYEANKSWIDPHKSDLFVNLWKGTIKFVTNNQDPKRRVTIGGLAKIPEELRQFHINENKPFTKKELQRLIKTNRVFFADQDHHSNLLIGFENFSMTLQNKIKDQDDNKGNVEKHIKQTMDSLNVDLEFTLEIPVLRGGVKYALGVDILVDVEPGNHVAFYLDSSDLRERLWDAKTQAITKELERFNDSGIPVIHQ